MANRSKLLSEAALWIFALFLAWVFLRQGAAKFSASSGWARAFSLWHFPVWFRMLIGAAEVSAALLLLLPRTALAGAMIIVAVMLGAMGTHIYWGHPEQVTSEILPLFLASMVALGRRRSFQLRPATTEMAIA